MYNAYFGFNSKPFKPKDPEDYFRSANFDAACADILGGIRERCGFILLTGEPGVGKSLALRRCMTEANDIRFILLTDANLDYPDILRHLSSNLELQINGLDAKQQNRLLLDALAEQARQNRTVALLIDDAQHLSVDVLLCLQKLVEMSALPIQRLQIVLAGLPEIANKLDQLELQGLRDSIRVRCHLECLSELDTRLFINHQLKVAGHSDSELLSPVTIERIGAYCKGEPRAIALLCDTILLFASLQPNRDITPEVVDVAAQSCFFGEQSRLNSALIGDGQLNAVSATQTLPVDASENANLDLDLSDFDFSFDPGGKMMRSKQPTIASSPVGAAVTSESASIPLMPPWSLVGMRALKAAGQAADTRSDTHSFEAWQGGAANDGIDAVPSALPGRNTQTSLPALPTQVDYHQFDSTDALRKSDESTSSHELQTPLLDSSPKANLIPTENVESRQSESLSKDGIDWIQANDAHAQETNKKNNSGDLPSAPVNHPWLINLINSSTEQENPMSRLDHLNKILKNIQNESPGAEASALISEDGLMIASALSQDLDETRVAGMTATLLNLGTRAATELRRGDVQEVIVRGEHGYAVMISAGRGALLLVLANESAKLGLIFFDMREAIKTIKNVL